MPHLAPQFKPRPTLNSHAAGISSTRVFPLTKTRITRSRQQGPNILNFRRIPTGLLRSDWLRQCVKHRLLEMSAIPLGECQQRCVGQLASVQPFSERKASLSACQVERQRRLDDGSRCLEHRGGDSHAPIGRHELVALGDHLFHFGGRIVHLASSSSLAAMPNFAAQPFR
jgi:hypothetical protein